MLTVDHWLVVAVTAVTVALCVVLHFEGLRLISDKLPTPHHHRRRRMVYIILSVLAIHVIEIWIFGLTYYGLLQFDARFGELAGLDALSLFDCVYYSAVVFSTLGFGDIVPKGHLRFVTGTEAVAGLTFITWSASYTFLTMSRGWTER